MFLSKRNFLAAVGLLSILFCTLAFVPVKAQSLLDSQVGMDDVSRSYGGANKNDVKDIRATTASIINVVIMLLGSIFVILIIVAGFLYMTSAGNEKQIEKSISYIKAGVIGLIIILAAWSITRFVFLGGSNYKQGGLIKATDSRSN